MPTVAIADDFLDAFARIPRAQQKKVREFTAKFKADPRSAAINYEKIHRVKDDKIRTVRIDQQYRAIVLHPEQGDVYVLLWVDTHDEAMAWAADRTFEINPRTGALQVINVEEVEQAVHAEAEVAHQPGLLVSIGDDVLLSFGVPEILLPAVRAIGSSQELLALGQHLPSEAAEALIWLAEGDSPEVVREYLGSIVGPGGRESPPAAPGAQFQLSAGSDLVQQRIGGRVSKKVDTTDLAAALQHPDSRRRFVTIHTDEELNSVLDAPLEKWRVFLHPSQERLVAKPFNGPARVTGGAGTGKTVVAMHRARHLARTLCKSPQDKILFTTYTMTLAQDVARNLAQLCGPEADRIEVVHLHAWAARFLRDQGRKFEVASPSELDTCWEEAIRASGECEFDPGFLRQEWEQVIQANEIQAAADYLKVPRIGRGRTLSRVQRQRVWKVGEHFVEALLRRGKAEWSGIIRDARSLLELKKPPLPYRAIVVDEAQDFHAEEWRLLRAIVPPGPNDLFLVGDAHQRLYGHKITLRSCGVQVQGRSSQLRINYRTTEEIRAWAMTMLSGVEIDDLDGGKDEEKGYKSLLSGPNPDVHQFSGRHEELEFIGERIRELVGQRPAEHICLVARTNKLLRDDYQPMLSELGIESTLLDQREDGGGVRLGTMHRVKGLEFPVMILAGVNAKYMPLPVPGVEDPVARADHEERERSLLFVAATRARDLLIVTGWGAPSPFLPNS
ncbi:MAG: UvrD-helicase domain-containing protein [Isosphaeraceae bacterium]